MLAFALRWPWTLVCPRIYRMWFSSRKRDLERLEDFENCSFTSVNCWSGFGTPPLLPRSVCQDFRVRHGSVSSASRVRLGCRASLVLPVEWSWAFWAVQMMHVRFAVIEGLGRDATLVRGWPAPELTGDGLGLPSCHNLSIVGLSLLV